MVVAIGGALQAKWVLDALLRLVGADYPGAGTGVVFVLSCFADPGPPAHVGDAALPLLGRRLIGVRITGGNERLGNYSIGLGADVFQKYRFDLKYIDYVGRFKDNGASVTSANGLTTYLRDRGFISLTFKTTF